MAAINTSPWSIPSAGSNFKWLGTAECEYDDTEYRCTRQTAVKVPLARPYRLLYVEDSPTDVNLVKRALVGFKLDVALDTVDDGDKAIRYLRREHPYQAALRPDLVLLDLNLPRIRGDEVLKFIKEDSDLKVVPVAIFTSAGTEVLCRPVYYGFASTPRQSVLTGGRDKPQS